MRRSGFVLAVLALVLAGCGGAAPAVPAAEVTRLVEVTRPIEVTRVVEVTKEIAVTRAVEVTRLVETVRQVEVTRLVEVTPTAVPVLPTNTPKPKATVAAVPMLTPEQLVAALKAAGLEAENVRPLTHEDYGYGPFVGGGLKILLPSLCDDCGGRIFSVPDTDERNRLREYYVGLGKGSAILFSWTFVKNNILLQLNGDMPEAQAKRYEAVLLGLKP